jgi:hypothetical protein
VNEQTLDFMKIWSLYNVGNGLYRVFTTAKRALSFQQKRVFIQEIPFSFFIWGTLAQKKALFLLLKTARVWGGGHMPPLCPSGSAAGGPCLPLLS